VRVEKQFRGDSGWTGVSEARREFAGYGPVLAVDRAFPAEVRDDRFTAASHSRRR